MILLQVGKVGNNIFDVAKIRGVSRMDEGEEKARRSTRSLEISLKVLTASKPSVTGKQVERLRWISVKVRDVKRQWKRST